jgi:hypothetical protein
MVRSWFDTKAPRRGVGLTKTSTAGGYDIALVTTDLTATPQEIIARYAARWSIEVIRQKSPKGSGTWVRTAG